VIEKPGREVLLLAPLLPSPQRIVVMNDTWRRCFKLERTQSDLVIASTLRHFFASPSCRPSQATFPTFAWRPGRVSPIQKPAQLSVLLDTVEPIEGPLLAQSGRYLVTFGDHPAQEGAGSDFRSVQDGLPSDPRQLGKPHCLHEQETHREEYSCP